MCPHLGAESWAGLGPAAVPAVAPGESRKGCCCFQWWTGGGCGSGGTALPLDAAQVQAEGCGRAQESDGRHGGIGCHYRFWPPGGSVALQCWVADYLKCRTVIVILDIPAETASNKREGSCCYRKGYKGKVIDPRAHAHLLLIPPALLTASVAVIPSVSLTCKRAQSR